jgi:hypothetical protein
MHILKCNQQSSFVKAAIEESNKDSHQLTTHYYQKIP